MLKAISYKSDLSVAKIMIKKFGFFDQNIYISDKLLDGPY